MSEASRQGLRRLGSYTTARVHLGRVERVEQHARRLARDAQRLGLAPPLPREVEIRFIEMAEAEFPKADGVIRLEWSRALESDDAPPKLIATPRALGELPLFWRARIGHTIHPGPEERRNTKAVQVAAYDASRDEMRRAGVEEVLLFGADGMLVEGCRSNILIVEDNGSLSTPDLQLGGVEGLGLEVVRTNQRGLQFARIDRASIQRAREIMAVNAVRGVIPITELDDQPVGEGSAGPVATALAGLFRRAAVA